MNKDNRTTGKQDLWTTGLQANRTTEQQDSEQTSPQVLKSSSPQVLLDLRGVTCTLNFVKTKIQLDKMNSGEILEVLLDSGEAIESVPPSIKEEGHEVLGEVEIES